MTDHEHAWEVDFWGEGALEHHRFQQCACGLLVVTLPGKIERIDCVVRIGTDEEPWE